MFRKLTITVVAILVALTLGSGVALAEQDAGPGSSKTVDLQFKVSIPQILLLRVGTANTTVNEVAFYVTDIPDVQPEVTGDYVPPLWVGAMTPAAQSLVLQADSSAGLTGGVGTLPFSKIQYSGSDDFSGLVDEPFDDTAAQTVWSGTGPGLRQGTLTFVYINDSYDYYGDYTGIVTYTLTAP